MPEGFRPSSRWRPTPEPWAVDTGKGRGCGPFGRRGRCVTSVVRWRRCSHGGRRRRRRRRLGRLRRETAVSGSHAPCPALVPGTERRAAPAPGYGLWASSAEHRGKVRAGVPERGAGSRAGDAGWRGRASAAVARGPGRQPAAVRLDREDSSEPLSSAGVCASQGAGAEAGAPARREPGGHGVWVPPQPWETAQLSLAWSRLVSQ